MVDLFGAPWEDLTREHLGEFFADAGDESLLWEAKGTRPHPGAVRKSVCGFANSERVAI